MATPYTPSERSEKTHQAPHAAMSINLPSMDGLEVSPGIWLVGEPTPIEGSNKLRCLANVGGALCLIELSLRFARGDE